MARKRLAASVFRGFLGSITRGRGHGRDVGGHHQPPRYTKDGFGIVTPEMTAQLEVLVKEIESQNVSFKGWATPGATPTAAALDLARTICRRAERRVCDLNQTGELRNAEIIIFLNRLSDLLWLFARWEETE